ncbi:mechanosensitive ion channel [Rubripirellula amarantea]|nr:mechanosensitive ion channel [Rubripirellula amarantea]
MFRLLAIAVLLVLLNPIGVIAQVGEQTSSATPATGLEKLREQVKSADLEEEAKSAALTVLDQAEKQAAEASSKTEMVQKRRAAIETVAARADSAKRSLEQLQNAQPSAPRGETLAELEAELASLTAKTQAAQQTVNQAETAMKNSAQRRAEIDTELPKLINSAEERKQQFENAVANADGTVANDAAIVELKTASELLNANVAALQAEKALLDAEAAASLPQLTRDLEARQAETLQKQLVSLRAIVEEKRAEDAASRVEMASKQLNQMHPLLRFIGEQNQSLAELNQTLAKKIEDEETRLVSRKSQLEDIRESFKQATSRVDKVGLTDAVGAMLRNLKQNLPSVGVYRMRIRERSSEIDDAAYALEEMTDRRNAKLSLTIDALLRQADRPVYGVEREELEKEALQLLETQRTEYLDPAIRNQTHYFNTLVSISTAEEEIIQLVEDSRKYINENVLWTRSTSPMYSKPFPAKAEWWFTLPAAWSGVGLKIISDMTTRLAIWIAAGLSLLTLLLSRYRLRAEITLLGEKASQSSFTHFGPTAKAFFWTVATSLPIPLFFGFLGSRFSSIAGNDRTLSALSLGCSTTAFLYFPLDFMRQVCRTQGLAQSHFAWPELTTKKVRQAIRPLLFIAVPIISIAAFLAGGSIGYGNDVLERYLSLLATFVFGLFIQRVAHPRRGVPARYIASHPSGWVNRTAIIWYPVIVAIPVGLGVLTVIGYHFTSQQIGWRIFLSLGLLFGIAVAVSLVMRWSLIHRRSLRMEQAKQARALAAETAASETPVPIAEDTAKDLQEQMQQSRNLFQTAMVAAAMIGLWIVWSDVVPALGIFEKWPLWSSTDTVTDLVKNENGDLIPHSREVVDHVTIAEVALACVLFGLTLAAARNLPGLLEFAVLRRLPIDRSIRYAVTSLVSYAIVLLGIIIAGGTIGLHWNQIQWMATALTFGLAFGLQEMFANFVAGIIILFEQPVRVGDVVEIDGVTGIVSKIRIRATTITDWDRKDYIVPNKEFITGKVLNWTRSDDVTRLVLSVGVAYGTDTQLAHQLILEAAAENPDVLEEPKTNVTFDAFGDNSLNFTLRAYLGTYEKRLAVTHDLHTSINRKFAAANIEISFPQRDLHLRSLPSGLTDFLRSKNQSSETTGPNPNGKAGTIVTESDL